MKIAKMHPQYMYYSIWVNSRNWTNLKFLMLDSKLKASYVIVKFFQAYWYHSAETLKLIFILFIPQQLMTSLTLGLRLRYPNGWIFKRVMARGLDGVHP